MSSDAPDQPARRGLLFIVSAASGTGKTTLVERLVQAVPNLRLSRSYTSRPARAGEHDGIDYNFITRDRFEQMAGEGEFLEWADVFGNYYGTSSADTEACLARGEDVVLVIDVQGARQVRTRGIETVGIFVLPPSAGGARAAPSRAQQGQRGSDPAAARGRAPGGRRVRAVPVRRHQRRG